MSPTRLEHLLRSSSKKRILVIGDAMLDEFVWGSVNRISPEAPVPVVNVERESTYPGGATNVARNLVPFAGQVHMVGLVGDDLNGAALRKILRDGGIDADGMLVDAGFPTITKTRIIARQQQVVRMDRERVVPLATPQVEAIRSYVEKNTGELDGLIIEDYGKGCVTQELADAVIPVARDAGLVVTVDPNPNNSLNWSGVTAVKPNRLEACREVGLAEHHWDGREHPLEDRILLGVGEELLKRWETQIVQITLGEHGMILFQHGEEPHHIPTMAKDVFDVSGAGDTAIALFTLALTAGATPEEAAEVSNFASGVVVGKLGTATLTPEELARAMRESGDQAADCGGQKIEDGWPQTEDAEGRTEDDGSKTERKSEKKRHAIV